MSRLLIFLPPPSQLTVHRIVHCKLSLSHSYNIYKAMSRLLIFLPPPSQLTVHRIVHCKPALSHSLLPGTYIHFLFLGLKAEYCLCIQRVTLGHGWEFAYLLIAHSLICSFSSNQMSNCSDRSKQMTDWDRLWACIDEFYFFRYVGTFMVHERLLLLFYLQP